MSSDFYRAFEDRHRGSRELIKSRLQVYSPFIEPLKAIYRQPKAVDLGCGRGEWLELLKVSGFDASGVDLDEGMLSNCRTLGLNVQNYDAIEWLKKLPTASQSLVTGFHLAEHLPFPILQTLVQEAFRVLQPAGLLILETPNPENIVVGSSNFYVDPTHVRPLPPQLLSFLPEYYGFGRVKVVRLQEDPGLIHRARLTFYDVLGGVSPDYAVVAQKAGDAHDLVLSNFAFERDYGPDLTAITERLEQQNTRDFGHAERAIHAVRAMADDVHQAQQRSAAALVLAEQVQERAAYLAAEAERIQQHMHQVDIAFKAIHQSRSWRITSPMRWLGRQARKLRGLVRGIRSGAIFTVVGQSVLRRGVSFMVSRPALRLKVVRWASRLGLHQALRALYWRSSGMAHSHLHVSPDVATSAGGAAALTPRARRIHADLVSAMERHNK